MTSTRDSQSRNDLERLVCQVTGATGVARWDRLQSLWSGYGEIVRAELTSPIEVDGVTTRSVIVKHVEPPSARHHPRGWSTSRSHERKLRSYAVEMVFYQRFAPRCTGACRVAAAHDCRAANDPDGDRWVFVLEDLDAAGFSGRRSDPSHEEIVGCLNWLAEFHATFLGTEPEGLWPVGTYWHLATRPDELAVMSDAELRKAAPHIDERLNQCRYQTLVHGDAKVENFCFDDSRSKGRGTSKTRTTSTPYGSDPTCGTVAAVDFQYVGGGTGMKDVAYFFSSCLDSRQCEAHAAAYLDSYFTALRRAILRRNLALDPRALESEWRALYPLAWADFYRFLEGWAPGHYKIHPYSQRMTRDALASL